MGRLAYTVPAITEILNGVPMSAFSTHYLANASENIEFMVSVDNTADATSSLCDDSWDDRCLV